MIGIYTATVYTFVDGNTGEPTHIDVTQLSAAIKRAGVTSMLTEITPSLIAALERGDLGVEEPHALTLPDEALDVPCIVCAWGDKHVIADGAHRLWQRWQRGDTDFAVYLVPEKAWRLFVIHDVPGDGKYWDNFNRNAKIRS